MLWTDKGKEFYNKHVAEVLRKNNIRLYSTQNEEKSSVVKRCVSIFGKQYKKVYRYSRQTNR